MAKIRSIIVKKIDGDDQSREKVRTYQKDGVTVQVNVGKTTKLTEEFFWVADLAKKVGDIEDYDEYEI